MWSVLCARVSNNGGYFFLYVFWVYVVITASVTRKKTGAIRMEATYSNFLALDDGHIG
jgi:hypothetical protein